MIWMRAPVTVSSMSAMLAQPRADLEHLGLEGLAPGERQELAGQLGRPLDRVGDRVQCTACGVPRAGRAAAGNPPTSG